MMRYVWIGTLAAAMSIAVEWPAQFANAQPGLSTMEQQLLAEDPTSLVQDIRQLGDAQRGAIVFHQPQLACQRCHRVDDRSDGLGPNLAVVQDKLNDQQLIQAVLLPSESIRKGYEGTTLQLVDGRVVSGIVTDRTPNQITLRDAAQDGVELRIGTADVDEEAANPLSLMPQGQVNQLASRQQFLDLMRYLFEIRDGGLDTALELQPSPTLYAYELPEYEQHVDHAGILQDLDGQAFDRGRAVYDRLCINCHGTHDQPGSLPTSLRFAEGQFKNGSDPYRMYLTLTHGFGMMMPQTWMVPQQKYDVIHYLREAYLKTHNPSQFVAVDQEYLSQLPIGDTRGPAPRNIEPWVNMNYGPSLINTYEIGDDAANFAQKGIAVRLDSGPGGISRGSHWMVFDHDTMRVAAAWSGQGFIDWNGIHFNGRHQTHPRVVGTVHIQNPTGPGWASSGGSFVDDRVVGRDGRQYGPLPRDWAHYQGLYHAGQQAVIAYTVGQTEVLESPRLVAAAPHAVFARTLNVGPRDQPLTMQVAHMADASQLRHVLSEAAGATVVAGSVTAAPRATQSIALDGRTYAEIADAAAFNMHTRNFTVTARIRTTKGGTILAKTEPGPKWVPDGKVFFVRGGRLCYDIGWVGVIQSRRRVNDGQWHDVAMTYEHESGQVQLFIDGQPDQSGRLRPTDAVASHVLRIGWAAPNFPDPSGFEGDLQQVRFFDEALSAGQIAGVHQPTGDGPVPVADWQLDKVDDNHINDLSGNGHRAEVHRAGQTPSTNTMMVAGISPTIKGARWQISDSGDLRLQLPAGSDPLRFTVWFAGVPDDATAIKTADAVKIQDAAQDLTEWTQGGAPRWPERLTTQISTGQDEGAFAVDILNHPGDNPWLCQVRLTGLDFFDDGDRVAICAWDGDVWLVSGLRDSTGTLTWQRIASGLFQPLGLRIVDGQIFVTCRDQLVVLRDLNGDGETDFYENYNNDHQVTEHFHEFAMGLQTDEQGNFYYAKSARHALKAVVPHHGTLLKITADGSKTEILATGFRAANGVCLNPDGSFIVTDQEGHWNPKNRINWVRPGGFYGNMFGYHDVTDSSDQAMQQPLCWITNSFDRSPAELLWVTSPDWGPFRGSLLNLSYGYGKIYVVPHEEINGQMQGGMCELPLPQFPTGIQRGRFHPQDGHLYTCGMFAWAGNQQQPGGWYRLRYTGQPAHLPIGLHASRDGMTIQFSDPLDKSVAADPHQFRVKVWSLKRTENYGSDHYDERSLFVSSVRITEDGKTVFLELPEIAPTWCMEIRYTLRGANGQAVRGTIHNTIHHLAE